MFASRALKPKLSLAISTSSAATPLNRPILGLKSPITPTPMAPLSLSPISSTFSTLSPLRSPTHLPILPQSPTTMNTQLNKRGFSQIVQQPTYSYVNSARSKSILKRSGTSDSISSAAPSTGAAVKLTRARQLAFSESPIVHAISPIEDPGYYGGYTKMSRDERRWMRRDL